MEISVFYANSVDPDQTPRSAASDLGLHCLPLSLLWDARLKWVKEMTRVSYDHLIWQHYLASRKHAYIILTP